MFECCVIFKSDAGGIYILASPSHTLRSLGSSIALGSAFVTHDGEEIELKLIKGRYTFRGSLIPIRFVFGRTMPLAMRNLNVFN